MAIAVHSEVGALEEVVVHAPGAEIVHMTQSELDGLLFDDILSLEEARREHALLQEILGAGGAGVHELQDLLAAGLAAAPPEAVADLLDRVCDLGACRELAPLLAAWPAGDLARGLIEGIWWRELDGPPQTLARLGASLRGGHDMALRPVPNLMFMRDPCISAFDRVVVGRMARPARAREPLIVRFSLEHAEVVPGLQTSFVPDDWDRHPAYRALEGGDVLVVDRRFLLVGCSERTTPQTLARVAEEALFPANPALQSIYAVLMPRRRSVMHLDTILTQIDHGLFLGHHPLIVGSPDRPGLPVVRLERAGSPTLLDRRTVLDVLRDELGDVDLVPCGGDDPLHQEREQWTDGANAVCIAPGRIVLYSRNRRTIACLADRFGFREVRLSVVQAPGERAALLQAGMEAPRTVFSFSGGELSRARGGARCLTMPLRRGPHSRG